MLICKDDPARGFNRHRKTGHFSGRVVLNLMPWMTISTNISPKIKLNILKKLYFNMAFTEKELAKWFLHKNSKNERLFCVQQFTFTSSILLKDTIQILNLN